MIYFLLMVQASEYFSDLKLRKDSQVADFGSGVGANAKLLAELVPDGKVFAIDVHKDLLEHIETDIKRDKNLANIIPVWGDFEELEGTRLRDDSIDAILAVNIFFLLKHKKTTAMEMKRVLKKGGRILFIDWYKHLGESTTHKSSVLREKDIEALFTEVGLSVHPRIYQDDYHFVLIIEKK